ncbi:MAG: biotin/lipoyl-containing protein, partial [Thermocrispum sp.]
PAPGRVLRLPLPAGPGIRVDTGFAEGDVIPADFDSMIAKIIAIGPTRESALARLRRALAETTVIIEGGVTNKSFLLDLLDQDPVVSATCDTGWIDRTRADGGLVADRHAGVALAAAAIEAYQEAERTERQRLLATAHGGRPQAQHEVGQAIDLKLRGASHRLRVAQIGRRRFRVNVPARPSGTPEDVTGAAEPQTVDVDVERYDRSSGRLTVNGRNFRVVSGTHGPTHLVEVDGVTHRISRDEGGVVRSPAPALVVATPVDAGAQVDAGAPVLVLESMKMETVLRAPFAATVKETLVSVGSQVETGAALLRLEPLGDGTEDADDAVTATELEFPPSPEPAQAERAAAGLADLRSTLLGFDVDPLDAGRLLTAYARDRAGLGPSGLLAAEIELLNVFADFSELSRNRASNGRDVQQEPSDPSTPETRVHSPREFFHRYLQSLDTERAGVPEWFTARLAKVLGHYDVADFERTDALEEAVFRIFLAQQRASSDVAVVTTLLRRWLVEPPPGEDLKYAAGEALEHLVEATQLRFPVVGDLARSVVFRWFAQPLLRRTRAEVYAGVRSHLRYLDANPGAADRAERVAAMVASPEPLVRLLGQRIARPG